ncbi:MAG: 4a-hydroxytetrahydrobiopterin dehydratase [Chloroflexota bacterium]|nr:4a-hydroxytetrahydrobiopterin dehydratase [Chloroflexota bacterium]MDE2910278.1 4a-hydroxytetrahydrobiopterin dehydratase [Chloroflexota bacterium]
MSKALSDKEIGAGLAKLNGWTRDGDELVQEFQFDNYLAGLAFASAVGVIAEGLNHHPDLEIGWRRARVSFTTHDAGSKITAKDLAAAEAIDGLGFPRA